VTALDDVTTARNELHASTYWKPSSSNWKTTHLYKCDLALQAAQADLAAAPSSTTTSGAYPYFVESFNGKFDQSRWTTRDTIDFAAAAPCVRVTVESGQPIYGYISTGCYPGNRTHTAYLDGSSSGALDGAGFNEDVWYRLKIRYPSGQPFQPGINSCGIEFHVDDKTASDLKALGKGAYSPLIGVYKDSTTGALSLMVRTVGCPYSQADLYGNVGQALTRDPVALQWDHWYDIVWHLKWGETLAKGLCEWWVDGVQKLSAPAVTQYVDDVTGTGRLSYGENVSLNNYRSGLGSESPAPSPMSVDFAQLVCGPSRASVGF
jgi:hypothetical protein